MAACGTCPWIIVTSTEWINNRALWGKTRQTTFFLVYFVIWRVHNRHVCLFSDCLLQEKMIRWSCCCVVFIREMIKRSPVLLLDSVLRPLTARHCCIVFEGVQLRQCTNRGKHAAYSTLWKNVVSSVNFVQIPWLTDWSSSTSHRNIGKMKDSTSTNQDQKNFSGYEYEHVERKRGTHTTIWWAER